MKQLSCPRYLVMVDKDPNTIASFVALYNKLDTKRRALQSNSRLQAPRHTPQVTPSSVAETVTATTSSGTALGPMDLSANRRRLSPEERTRRLAEGRCYRCGGMNHVARNCPLNQQNLSNQQKPKRGSEAILSPQGAPLPLAQ